MYSKRRGINPKNAYKSDHDRTTKNGGSELEIEF